MDVCVRKPLLVTCGLDKSVRIWNYQECTLDLMRFFAEEPYSVAFHPSGLHILVGFIDKLRLMNLLIEDIRPFKEFPIKACREVQFSHGGQYFAAVNGSTIQIFSTYTGENIGNCRGHNGKVRSVHWSSDDSTLVSCGMDGAVYEWELKEGTHTQEYIQKGCNFAAACISNEGKVYAAGSDHSIKEITESQATASFDTALNLSCLALSSRFLLAGSEGGAIKQYKLPLNGQSIDAYVHSAPVVRLRVTSDDSLCFSTGEDGCVVIYEVCCFLLFFFRFIFEYEC
jgi:WD40 repeat protein